MFNCYNLLSCSEYAEAKNVNVRLYFLRHFIFGIDSAHRKQTKTKWCITSNRYIFLFYLLKNISGGVICSLTIIYVLTITVIYFLIMQHFSYNFIIKISFYLLHRLACSVPICQIKYYTCIAMDMVYSLNEFRLEVW